MWLRWVGGTAFHCLWCTAREGLLFYAWVTVGASGNVGRTAIPCLSFSLSLGSVPPIGASRKKVRAHELTYIGRSPVL